MLPPSQWGITSAGFKHLRCSSFLRGAGARTPPWFAEFRSRAARWPGAVGKSKSTRRLQSSLNRCWTRCLAHLPLPGSAVCRSHTAFPRPLYLCAPSGASRTPRKAVPRRVPQRQSSSESNPTSDTPQLCRDPVPGFCCGLRHAAAMLLRCLLMDLPGLLPQNHRRTPNLAQCCLQDRSRAKSLLEMPLFFSPGSPFSLQFKVNTNKSSVDLFQA